MAAYHYKACGLDNIIIQGLEPFVDEDGDSVVSIPRVRQLHKAIAEAIVSHETGMNNKELRFLRTEMGLTQEELADLLECDRTTIWRWEHGEHSIDGLAEALVRLLAIEKLNLQITDRRPA